MPCIYSESHFRCLSVLLIAWNTASEDIALRYVYPSKSLLRAQIRWSRPANIISYNYLMILFIIGLAQKCYLYLFVSSAKLLEDAYRTEQNGDVRERLLLVRLVLVDNEQTARVAENEFHRSRWWAYKWVKRYVESGLEGLKNLPKDWQAASSIKTATHTFAEFKRELKKKSSRMEG